MRDRAVRFGAIVALALFVAPFAVRAENAPPAALAACANPSLPREILDGPFAGAHDALPLERVDGAAVPLVVAVASDDRSQELGLMCVTHLRAHRGMLFVFANDDDHGFWMKNTLVPLDMVWVTDKGVVTMVAAHVPASTRETPDARVARRTGYGKYVIELPSGEAAADGVATGVTLHFSD